MSKLSYLIDIGAEVSVLPPCLKDSDRSPVNNIQLQAANGNAILTFGQRYVADELGLAKSFEWRFTIIYYICIKTDPRCRFLAPLWITSRSEV